MMTKPLPPPSPQTTDSFVLFCCIMHYCFVFVMFIDRFLAKKGKKKSSSQIENI